MSAISFILAHLVFQPVMAATFDVPVSEGDRLVLRGLEAQVQMVAQPGAALRVSGVEQSGAEGVFIIEKKNNIIEVRMNEYSGKRTWLNILPKANTQLKKIEITGPALPAEVQLRGGSVVAQKWNKDLKVSLTQGRVAALNGAGTLQVYVQKGDVSVSDHLGKVEADSYSGSMTLKNIQGDVEASLFSGQMNIEKVRGFLTVSAQQSAAKVNQSNGTIQFESGKGSLNIQGFQGRIEGQNQDAAITIGMTLDSEVDVKSKSGKVSIQTPPGSGASLNLMTVEGEIVVPSELRVTKLSAEKSVRGRLRGDAPRGSIFVRSQDGTISVK